MSKYNAWLGIIVGVVLIVIPEPTTSALGLGVVGYSCYKAGWLGKM